MRSTCVTSLAASLAFTGLATGQQPGDSGAIPERRLNTAFETAATGPVSAINSLSQYCSALVTTDPNPIAPGANGQLLVMLSMRGNAVVPPTGRVQLDYQATQDGVGLGRWSIAPAPTGKMSPAWRGRPVYEDTTTISIPLSADAGLPLGSHAIELTLSADVYRGDDGAVIGRAQMPIRGMVVVGRSTGSATATTARSTLPGSSPHGAAASGPTDNAGGAVGPGRTVVGEPVATAVGSETNNAETDVATEPPPPTIAAIDWLLPGAAAALLLGIGALLLLHRPRRHTSGALRRN